MRDPLTDDGNVQASQQWTINGGPQLDHLPFLLWAGAGCTWWRRHVSQHWPSAGPAWHADGDADLEVSDTCVRSSLLSWVELSLGSRPMRPPYIVARIFKCSINRATMHCRLRPRHPLHESRQYAPAVVYIGWQWRSFVPYICQLDFAAILWVKLINVFTVASLKHASLVGRS